MEATPLAQRLITSLRIHPQGASGSYFFCPRALVASSLPPPCSLDLAWGLQQGGLTEQPLFIAMAASPPTCKKQSPASLSGRGALSQRALLSTIPSERVGSLSCDSAPALHQGGGWGGRQTSRISLRDAPRQSLSLKNPTSCPSGCSQGKASHPVLRTVLLERHVGPQ